MFRKRRTGLTVGFLDWFSSKTKNNVAAHYLYGGENFDLWNADMEVLLYSEGLGDLIRPLNKRDNFRSEEAAEAAEEDRRAKAMLWFSVSQHIRKKHLLRLSGREATCLDVFLKLQKEVRPGIDWLRVSFVGFLGFLFLALLLDQ